MIRIEGTNWYVTKTGLQLALFKSEDGEYIPYLVISLSNGDHVAIVGAMR